MQFMIIRKADAATEAGLPPSPALAADRARFHAALRAAGALGPALDLHPSAAGVRLRMGPDGETIDASPFPEVAELVAGFTIVRAPSKEAAMRLLERWPARDCEGSGEVVLELRETGCPGGCAEVPAAAGAGGKRYVILLRATADTERDAIPAQARLDALNAFNAAQVTLGVLLAGDGLKSSARGARLQRKGGRTTLVDGPFAEAKELIAGFWMIGAASLRDAVDWARSLPYPTGPDVEVEIREVAAPDGPALEP
ncbi:hypothetical protein HH212_16465 [Massilia forsythiae]|uniref:YCII-related domain-containing protein n=1 Tax=Massilia forsythiae TaxID=2728020 RepID=A0A7Z2ZTJ0_9BURK|nr:YciI family protein [Massilia forsythiae]QJE01434.1 hypothetical protein HH212_16465 [Massilia forsythiae]